MVALGEPLPPVASQEKTSAHGAHAPVSYCPALSRSKDDMGQVGRGTRLDGRESQEMRACHLRVATVGNATGSAYFEQGCTKVVATVYGPREATHARERTQTLAEGLLLVDLQFAAFCSRASTREENDRRAMLYASLLQGALESLVPLEQYAASVIDLHICVLEDDGSALTVALGAGALALADAAIETSDLAAGATVHLARLAGSSDQQASLLLDCDAQDCMSMPEGNSVLHLGLCPAQGRLCLIHSAGPLPDKAFEQMVRLARDAAEVVGAEMRSCLDRRAERQAAKRKHRSSATPAMEAAAGGDALGEEE